MPAKRKVSIAANQALQDFAATSQQEQERLCELIASGNLSAEERMQILVRMANLSTELVRKAADLEDTRD